MNDKDRVMIFLREKFQREHLKEDVTVFKLVHDSIEFVKLLSEIEDVIDKEINLELIEDITKRTVGEICNYT